MAAQQTYYTYTTPFGPLTLQQTQDCITRVVFGEKVLAGSVQPHALTSQAATEIMEYLAGKRMAFSVPFYAEGTPYQKSVWERVCCIPYGQTRTSREVAETLGKPHAFRTIGSALRLCPTPLLVPVHRVLNPAHKSNPQNLKGEAAIAVAFRAIENKRI
jgi:methylated-DNA-[protein]-cysteine S-methyltransferase